MGDEAVSAGLKELPECVGALQGRLAEAEASLATTTSEKGRLCKEVNRDHPLALNIAILVPFWISILCNSVTVSA